MKTRVRRSRLDREIVALAVPALGALAVEPLGALAVEPLSLLVDVAVVGHPGTRELAALAPAATIDHRRRAVHRPDVTLRAPAPGTRPRASAAPCRARGRSRPRRRGGSRSPGPRA